MDVFLATQPIFDTENRVFGYEILYRENEQNAFSEGADADFASGNALVRCFLDFGLSTLTNNTHAFVNFTAEFLKNEVATLFPKDQLVIEILENVEVTEEILNACRRLKARGYLLAIDDFVYQSGYEDLLPLVDIIKVDFKQSGPAQQAEIVRKYKRRGLSFLAEKVETQEERDRALGQGYSYFQGYFYARPSVNRTKKLKPYSQTRMRLINMLYEPEPDLRQIAGLIETDIAFSYEILRLVNSAYYSPATPIKSVSFAISVLGIEELRKWLYIVFISGLQENKPGELIRASLLRGKFMENLAEAAGRPDRKSTMMTIGMFSLLDVLLDRPMQEALEGICFPEEVKSVLIGSGGENFLQCCGEVAVCYEHGIWQEALQKAMRLGITSQMLQQAYTDAVKWMETFYR